MMMGMILNSTDVSVESANVGNVCSAFDQRRDFHFLHKQFFRVSAAASPFSRKHEPPPKEGFRNEGGGAIKQKTYASPKTHE